MAVAETVPVTVIEPGDVVVAAVDVVKLAAIVEPGDIVTEFPVLDTVEPGDAVTDPIDTDTAPVEKPALLADVKTPENVTVTLKLVVLV